MMRETKESWAKNSEGKVVCGGVDGKGGVESLA